MTEAIAMAREYGIGLASVKNSSHFGMAASYVLQAVRAGYMSMVFTNASRAMPPWGGREPLLGTSPFAAGAPGGKLPPFVLDMAVAVAARGKIRLAAKRGESHPGRLRPGQATAATPPIRTRCSTAASSCRWAARRAPPSAMMMDIFTGVFSGSAFAGDVTNHTEEFTKPQNVGHFMLAIKPDLFMPMAEFLERMDVLTERVKGVAPAQGFDEVLVAGEPEARKEAERPPHRHPIAESRTGHAEGRCRTLRRRLPRPVHDTVWGRSMSAPSKPRADLLIDSHAHVFATTSRSRRAACTFPTRISRSTNTKRCSIGMA